MIIKKYLGKKIYYQKLLDDIKERRVSGVHFFDNVHSDNGFKIVELIIGQIRDYRYAFKIYLNGKTIARIQRIKFQSMCGGWRSSDIFLKRLPVGLSLVSNGIIYSAEVYAGMFLDEYIEMEPHNLVSEE